MPAQGGGISSSWVASLQTSFSGFVSNVVVARLTPVLAAFCVLKAALDAAEGYSPLGSIFLRAESGARCGGGVQPARVHRRRHFSAVCVRHGPAFPELEQRVTVRNHRHADRILELSRWDDPAGSSRIGDCGS